jgi:hypothetical protein
MQSNNHQTLWEEPSFVRHTQSINNKTFFALSRHQEICVQQVKPRYENPRCLAHFSKNKTFARFRLSEDIGKLPLGAHMT